MQLPEIFEAFNHLKVLIIGDLMIDSYVWGKVDRISPEAPVPVLSVQKREKRLGGAGNVVMNIAALGAQPIICSVIGHDNAGQNIIDIFTENKISTAGILQNIKRPTTIKERLIASSQQLVRIDSETTEPIDNETNNMLFAKIEAYLLVGVDVIIFEDYDKGVIGQDLIEKVTALAISKKTPIVVDPKKRNFLFYKKANLFKPNLKELREGLGVAFDHKNDTEIDRTIASLKEKLELEGVFLTLSERGVVINYKDVTHRVPAHIRSIADVSGAGDTVISIAACCIALGLSPQLVAGLANLGGGLVCEQLGVVPINKQMLLAEALLCL
jgi:D-glycero-beta-D-manno-heptose-7-phosphate kinase